MGAGCSSLLARRSSRRSLCPWLRPGGRSDRDAANKGRRQRQADVAYATGPGNPLGVVVMPLQNPPDVIEAHQRYFSRGAEASVPALRQQNPVKYSYFSASSATDAARPRAAARPAARPALDGGGALHAASQDAADLPLPRDRTLPTQHQHPSPGSPRYPRRWTTTASAPEVAAADRPRCRRQSHGHGARPRPARAPRCAGRTAGRACRASRTARAHRQGPPRSRGIFGYDIQDVDSFLAKASLEKPANIPMVLACPSTLYRTEEGGWQQEVPLPLGMVVNGVFRVDSPSAPSSSSCWLYAQTPHGHEGYVRYAACLPLGILATPVAVHGKATTARAPSTATRSASPSPSSAASSDTLPLPATRRMHGHAGMPPLARPAWGRGRAPGHGPSWDTASDIFPATLAGNQTDTDKAKDTRSERAFSCARGSRASRGLQSLQFQQGQLEARRAERSVDELYLRSIRSGSTPTYSYAPSYSYAGGSMYFSGGVHVC